MKRFNSKLRIFIFIAVLLAIASNASILTYFGKITGITDVNQPILIDGENYLLTQHFSWHGVHYPHGLDFIETHVLENVAYSEITIDFNTTCNDIESFNESIIWNGSCQGIKTQYVEYFDDAGAGTNYEFPIDCDIEVTNGAIQDAIDSSSDGDVICVGPGIYEEDISIDKSIELVSQIGKKYTIIKGQSTSFGGAVNIDSGYVKFKGFTVLGSGTTAVYLSDDLHGIEITYNNLVSAKGGTALYVRQDQLNHLISNNVFEGDESDPLVFVKSSSSKVNFINNTFNGTIYPGRFTLDMGASISDILGNKFITLGDYSAINLKAMNSLMHYNNFEGLGYDVTCISSCQSFPCMDVDAGDNWWGLDGIKTIPNINATYKLKDDLTISANETDIFGIITTFATNIPDDTYSMILDIVLK